MSAALDFLRKVKSNPELQAQMASVDWDAEVAVPLAKDLGYHFSAEELYQALAQMDDELNLEELQQITAGWFSYADFHTSKRND